jgi:NDP-sugar pyrophosphorylase family protein
MHILIPMAGHGQRFADAGYKLPKPLIEVDGKPMVEHVVGLFSPDDRYTFLCQEQHLRETGMEATLRRIAPQGAIIPISVESKHKGPVAGILRAADRIDVRAEPTIINYCDFSLDWEYADFKRFVAKGYDGAIICYTGFHPHMLGSTYYGYARTGLEGRLLELREKQPFTDDPMGEHAAAGGYYFKDGNRMLDYFVELVGRGLCHSNGEYYASLPYNLMVRDGLDTRVYDVRKFMQWGTPEDLQEYNAWSAYFKYPAARREPFSDSALELFQRRFPQRTPDQLRKTHAYWQEYFRKTRGA